MIASPTATEPPRDAGGHDDEGEAGEADDAPRASSRGDPLAGERAPAGSTWSGTEPAIIAATLESIRVSASVTTPDAEGQQRRRRGPRRPRASRHGHAQASARGARGSAASSSPASANRSAGREKRRHRLDRHLDREVRRAPDEVDVQSAVQIFQPCAMSLTLRLS